MQASRSISIRYGKRYPLSRDDTGFFESRQVVPLVAEIKQDLFGMFGVLRPATETRRPLVELDRASGQAKIARLVLDFGDISVGDHLGILDQLGNPGVGRPRKTGPEECLPPLGQRL